MDSTMVGLRHSDPINVKGYLTKRGKRLQAKTRRFYRLTNTILSQHLDEVRKGRSERESLEA